MKKEKIIIEIVTPKTATTVVENGLVDLTKYLVKHGKDDGSQGGFGLGGEYGYGVDFENDTFMMHAYCWCDKDDCEWCFMNDLSSHGKKMRKILLEKYGNKEWSEMGLAPEFFYKPTGLLIRWYKWIGRDTEMSKKVSRAQWEKIYADCIKSLRKKSKG